MTDFTERIAILSAEEIHDLYGLPRFSQEERRLYFSMDPQEQSLALSGVRLGSYHGNILILRDLSDKKGLNMASKLDLRAKFSGILLSFSKLAWSDPEPPRCCRLAENPVAQPADDLQERLTKIEMRIAQTFAATGEDQLTDEAYENFYRLLGSFRGPVGCRHRLCAVG